MNNRKTLKIKKIDLFEYLIDDIKVRSKNINVDRFGITANYKTYLFDDYVGVEIETDKGINIFSINKSNKGLIEYLEHLGFRVH